MSRFYALLLSDISLSLSSFHSFFFKYPSPTELYTLSLHDALPISPPAPTSARCSTASRRRTCAARGTTTTGKGCARSASARSEEHTSELQSPYDLVCRLLLEKKKKKIIIQ